jgi:hypothetical protein
MKCVYEYLKHKGAKQLASACVAADADVVYAE